MDEPLTDRRLEARRPWPVSRPARATLRPGCIVALVDLSDSGALVQGGRPLRPGARVHLQIVTDLGTLSLAALVVRCAVWALDDTAGATYRGALRFEQHSDSIWRMVQGE